ncbi:universal stress protein [Mucilaginibacter gossypiicola]|nr:universal stress protein [Mucilaginibacter gossypiicola]
MKTVIALTDFSPNATHAAHFALKLAMSLKANLLLCNAYLLPSEIPSPYTVGWPVEEYDMLSEESTNMLNLLKSQLETWRGTLRKENGFSPQISVNSSFGNLCSVIKFLSSTNNVAMIVAGTHDKDRLNTFLQGNNMKSMVNNLDLPLLLVPPAARFNDIRRIAFATDLTSTKDDIEAIESLTKLTEALNAEILLTTVDEHDNYFALNERFMQEILNTMALKNKNDLLSTKILRSKEIENELATLCVEEHVDMLAMVHHHLGFIKRLFKGSHTLEMTKNVNVPILIFNARVN